METISTQPIATYIFIIWLLAFVGSMIGMYITKDKNKLIVKEHI